MRSLHDILVSRFTRRVDVHVDAAIENTQRADPVLSQDKEFLDVIHSPLREIGDVNEWMRNHPSFEYTLWIGHITRKASTPEEKEAILRKKVPRRLRSAERAPLMHRAWVSMLGAVGVGTTGVVAYGMYETITDSNVAGAILCGVAALGSTGIIKDAVDTWKSPRYSDLVEEAYREHLYHDRAIAKLNPAQYPS